MKALVIAEKPSVGRDIARVLKCGSNKNGVLEGEGYVVTWAMGHLVELSDPEGYDNKYKEWKLSELPIIPEKWKYDVLKKTGRQFNTIKAQLSRPDIGEVIIATDAGREGELVARLILLKTGCKKPIKRLWVSSVTDKAIREGFAHLKNGREYDNLYAAALCRAEADWLVGINATRALTCKYNAQLSCGRVQTPTLAMIAKREEEIRSFVPKSYYGLEAQAKGFRLVWRNKRDGSSSSFDKEKITALQNSLEGKKAVITGLERQPKKTGAPLLYDLTELQREANRRFGFSAKETLNIMQRLYENHKVLTYPRTDSRYLTPDIVATIPERLKACGTGPYRKFAGKLQNTSFSTKAAFVREDKVSDHHAIIPTEQYVQLEHMTVEERKIYDLVVRRFLAVLYPPYEYEETKLMVDIGGESFTARGQSVIRAGWRELYEMEAAQEESLEEAKTGSGYFSGEGLQKGGCIEGLVLQRTEGKTKPPAPFNEASLLSAMENPIHYMESRDKEQIKALGETGGLGTVATRADIIEKLFHSFLIEKRGKDIFITSKAKQLLALVPEDLKRPELTADWELRLSKIAKGELSREAFMESIRSYTEALIGEIKAGEGSFRHDNLTNKRCPACGKRLLAVKGKNSRLLVCQDRECGYRETVARTSNARCPVCRKKMELIGQGEKQTFVCTCGYKERLSAFQERRKREGGGVSRREVARYMNKQRQEAQEPLNTGLAEALRNIGLKKSD